MAKEASTEGEGDEARDSESARWKAGEEGLCVSDREAVTVSAMFAVCLLLSPLVYFLSSTVTRLPSCLVSRVSCLVLLSRPILAHLHSSRRRARPDHFPMSIWRSEQVWRR